MDKSQTVITFGKYNGQTYEFVRKTDVQKWLKLNTRKATCECCNGTGVIDVI